MGKLLWEKETGQLSLVMGYERFHTSTNMI